MIIHSQESFISVSQALEEKYCQQEGLVEIFYEPKDKKISTQIAYIGFDRVADIQKQLKRLCSVDLSGRKIASSSGLDKFKDSLTSVKILNLDNNHLDWKELVNVVGYFPNLKELIVSKNNLSHYDGMVVSPEKPLRTLSSLTLGYTQSDWSTIVAALSLVWSCIESLDLWNCALTPEKMILSSSSAHALTMISNLRSIRLSYNCYHDLDWLSCFGPTENLQELDVSNCSLEVINIDDVLTKKLVGLKSLNIAHNKISSWDVVSRLNSFLSLVNLICHHNPFMETEKLSKPFIIARIARLQILNREEISSRYRTDSEILYMRKTYLEYHPLSEADKSRFLIRHPRLKDLVDYYGAPEVSKSDQVHNKYINVELCFLDKKISKKLPLDMRVSSLRMLCKRLFKLKTGTELRIDCVNTNDAKLNDIRYLLDRDSQTLDFFSVVEGCQLLIEELS